MSAIAPAAAHARPICGQRAPTITRVGKVRVYVGTVRNDAGYRSRRTVACVKGGKRFPLDDPDDAFTSGESSKVARRTILIRGLFIAFVIDRRIEEATESLPFTRVDVVDLTTGNRREGCASGDEWGCDHPLSRPTDMALTTTGTLAFVGHRELNVIYPRGRRARPTSRVAPHSLMLAGFELSWTEDAEPRSMTLP